LLPALLSLQLCVAWLIGSRASVRTLRGRGVTAAGVLVIAGAIASQLFIFSSDTWWNKGFSADNAGTAAIINAADRPLLISTPGEVNPGEVLSLGYFLQERVRLLLLGETAFPELPAGYDRYYVLYPPWDTLQAEAHGYTLLQVHGADKLWELRRQGDRQHGE
jgi:hypothetical protein